VESRPYVICVMTSFLENERDGEEAISKVSLATWKMFDRLGGLRNMDELCLRGTEADKRLRIAVRLGSAAGTAEDPADFGVVASIGPGQAVYPLRLRRFTLAPAASRALTTQDLFWDFGRRGSERIARLGPVSSRWQPLRQPATASQLSGHLQRRPASRRFHQDLRGFRRPSQVYRPGYGNDSRHFDVEIAIHFGQSLSLK